MVKAAMEAAGRNPSVKDDVFSRMIIAMALTESIAIYSLVIALLILFV
jgi:F-type H+-transporting ATPase subunit c